MITAPLHPPGWLRLRGALRLLAAALLGLICACPASAASPLAVVQQYCFDCHGEGMSKGDVTLDRWPTAEARLADRTTWRRVMQALQNREMPPAKKPQPNDEERAALMRWIEKDVFQCDCDQPDPGRVTLRRLNRAEYNNTIRDLLGVDLKLAEEFPVDGSGHGFDTIGDALAMPPILLEKQLAAARKALEAAFGWSMPQSSTRRFSVDELEVGYNAKQQGDGWVALNTIEEDDVAAAIDVPAESEYLLRVHAYGRPQTANALRLTFMLDGQPLKEFTVSTNRDDAPVYEVRVTAPAGRRRFRAVMRRNKEGLSVREALRWKSGREQKGAIMLEWLEVEGPLRLAESVMTRRATMFGKDPEPGREQAAAREILSAFARRAFRRPVAPEESARLVALAQRSWEEGESFGPGLALAMQAILVSPHFIYRGELQPEPGNPKAVHPVNEHALAARLSYFLWSTLPDEALSAEADRGTLRSNLTQQVRRLLASPRSRALVHDFAGQWLELRNLANASPDPGLFEPFNDSLRDSMREETERFFEGILREDRSVLEFLTADYTFADERLAKFYGLSGVKGEEFQRVSLAATPRRGLLGHASVLTLTSNPTRTSPVKRGKWLLDNLLDAPPPPPPPEVPELKDSGELKGTLRQRMEQHRANVLCASCHARMDPPGFALENFDGIGAWRTKDGESPVDASGEFTTGEKFDGVLQLSAVLAGPKREQFVRALASKLLTYALGRGLEFADKCTLDRIVAHAAAHDYRFSELILAVVQSVPFQMRRGDSSAPAP